MPHSYMSDKTLKLLQSSVAALVLLLAAQANSQTAETASDTDAPRFRQIEISEYGGPEVLSLVHHSELPSPGNGEVRLRVLTAGVSFTDVMIRKGIYPGLEAEFPYAPGYDLVGVVDELGADVTGLTVGQRVADLSVWGAYSDYVIRPADGLVVLPPSVDSAEAVSLILSYVTAYQMMHRVAHVEPGQSVLIHGASGGVGTALAQLGKAAGLKMFGTASTSKQDYVESLDVFPIDYKTEDFVARVMEETDQVGIDVVFDAVGVDNFKRSYSVINAEGLLIPYGFYSAAVSADVGASLDVIAEFMQFAWLQFRSNMFSGGGHIADMYSITGLREMSPEWFKEDLGALFDLLADGQIKPNLWEVLPLEDAVLAHGYLEDGSVQGKIVLELSNEPAWSSRVQSVEGY